MVEIGLKLEKSLMSQLIELLNRIGLDNPTY